MVKKNCDLHNAMYHTKRAGSLPALRLAPSYVRRQCRKLLSRTEELTNVLGITRWQQSLFATQENTLNEVICVGTYLRFLDIHGEVGLIDLKPAAFQFPS